MRVSHSHFDRFVWLGFALFCLRLGFSLPFHAGFSMDYDSPCSGQPMGPPNFAFAFNDSNFSDRVLRIEIMAGPATMKADDGTTTIADWDRNRKRRRADAKKDAGGPLFFLSVFVF